MPPVAGGITQPPPGPVRMMAEWEEVGVLAVTWHKDVHTEVLSEIIRHARTQCTVLVHCMNAAGIENAKTELLRRGIDTSSNVLFTEARSNSIWIRDYGANAVYLNEVDSLVLTDWIYNRLRPLDDTLALKTARILGRPLYVTTLPPYQLTNTGGNVLTDGMGTAFSSKLVLKENQPGSPWVQQYHDEAGIDSVMRRFTGIRRYLKMDMLPYDGIHHVDMHLKLLDEETLLVGQYPEGVSDGPQIEANLQYLLSQESVFGRPYRVIRMPMPPVEGQYPPFDHDPLKAYLYPTYVNSLILNRIILMPAYGTAFDEQAKKVYEAAMPGYRVIPIHCGNLIYEGGALHCITKETGNTQPLRIVHRPARSIVGPVAADYLVEALIQHRSGIESATVYYTADSSSVVWTAVPMRVSANPDSLDYWTGYIPRSAFAGEEERTLYYYIEATAHNGKKQVRPMPAPKGWWPLRISRVSSVAEATGVYLSAPFPNPARAITCIPVESRTAIRGAVLLCTAAGEKVETIFEGLMPSGPSRYFLDASRFVPGLYFVVIQGAGGIMARHLLIMK